MKTNKTYTINEAAFIPAGNNANFGFSIVSPGRDINIKSILIDISFYAAAPQAMIPITNNTIFDWILELTNIDSLPFGNLSGPVPNTNGKNLQLYTNGQTFYDSLKGNNNIDFGLSMSNLSAATNYSARATIVIETFEEIIR